MMKRLFGVCLAAALVMASVAGCGSDSATETTEPAVATESAEAANKAAGEESTATAEETAGSSEWLSVIPGYENETGEFAKGPNGET